MKIRTTLAVAALCLAYPAQAVNLPDCGCDNFEDRTGWTEEQMRAMLDRYIYMGEITAGEANIILNEWREAQTRILRQADKDAGGGGW